MNHENAIDDIRNTLNEFKVNRVDIDFIQQQQIYGTPEKQSISFAVNFHEYGIMTRDIYLQNMRRLLVSEITNAVYKKIVSSIKVDAKEYFLDFSTLGGKSKSKSIYENRRYISNEIYRKVTMQDSKYLLTNNRLTSEIFTDSPYFNIKPFDKNRNNNYIYNYGNFDHCELYVDSFMKYDDNFCLLFDKCFIDMGPFDIKSIDEATFSPRALISYDIKCLISNPKILFIFEDGYMNNYGGFKQARREERIDDILSE